MIPRGDDDPGRTAGRARADGTAGIDGTDARSADGRASVVGNERLTALAGAVLLVLIVVELVTTASLRTLLSICVFLGVLLAGPLTVKLGSTRYRFVRYCTRAPAYVCRGQPRLALRVP